MLGYCMKQSGYEDVYCHEQFPLSQTHGAYRYWITLKVQYSKFIYMIQYLKVQDLYPWRLWGSKSSLGHHCPFASPCSWGYSVELIPTEGSCSYIHNPSNVNGNGVSNSRTELEGYKMYVKTVSMIGGSLIPSYVSVSCPSSGLVQDFQKVVLSRIFEGKKNPLDYLGEGLKPPKKSVFILQLQRCVNLAKYCSYSISFLQSCYNEQLHQPDEQHQQQPVEQHHHQPHEQHQHLQLYQLHDER